MDMKWILAIAATSLFIGGLTGALVADFASFIGATVFSFALIFSIAFYISNKRKVKREEDGTDQVEAESEEVPEERTFDRATPLSGDPLVRDRMIEAFMKDFGMNRDKAENLFDAGYSKWSDFSEAIPEDLLMVKGINPTVARRIITTVRSRS